MKILYKSLIIKLLSILIGLGIGARQAQAQADYNLTQYQNTPLLTNPAMVGMSNDTQFLFNFRNQPNATGDSFTIGMLSAMHGLVNKKTGKRWGGLGLSILNDHAGQFIRTNAGMLAFAFNQKLGNNRLGTSFLSLGIQGGYFQRRLDIEGLTTSSQYQNGNYNPILDRGENVENFNQGFGVGSLGLMWYATDSLGRQTMFLGVSGMNLNEPRTSFYDATLDRLPHHLNFTGGVRVLNTERFSVFPNFRWVRRTGNNQVNAGSWLNYHLLSEDNGFLRRGMASVGLWYNFNNAFVGAIQLDQPKYFATLSFDLPTTGTSNLWQGTNAFEITVGYKIRREYVKREKIFIPPLDKNLIPTENNLTKPEFIPIPLNKKIKKRPETKPGLEDGAFRFKYNSSELDDASKILLDSVAQILMEFPEAIIEVAGHTCDIGTDARNLELSRNRAESMRKYLADYDGIDPKRITIAAFGESRPLVPNLNEDNRRKNRRVAFKMKFPE
jgi:type IX secretion system PorP/SprF family membrane protein